MPKLKNLRDGLICQLRDLYSVETQLVKALPQVQKEIGNKDLKQALESHLQETRIHVERLDEIARLLEEKLTGVRCKGMQGLIAEARQALGEKAEDSNIIDALVIGCAQRIEHYEVAAYGTARAFAEELGEDKIAALLDETLTEEAAADKKLTEISLEQILPEAHVADVDDFKPPRRHHTDNYP